jgi:hypothetical protein
LGNQLFQVSFGLWLQNAADKSCLRFDASPLKRDRYGRGLAVDQVGVFSGLKFGDYPPIIDTIPGIGRAIVRQVLQRMPPRLTNHYFERDPFRCDVMACALAKDGMYFDGYWQSFKYCQAVAARASDLFHERNRSAEFMSLLHAIEGSDSVAVHARSYNEIKRAGRSWYHCRRMNFFIGSNYYTAAVQRMSRSRRRTWFVFSDDHDWARRVISLPGKVVWVNTRRVLSDLEELLLMASCKAQVIANSTFSWWGAWLGRQETVIAPRYWASGVDATRCELIPRHWDVLG